MKFVLSYLESLERVVAAHLICQPTDIPNPGAFVSLHMEHMPWETEPK